MSIYLDYNASAPTREAVVNAMLPHFRENHGNPSSAHFFGQRARTAVETARQQVAELINAEVPEEILFLSGGTEADNMVLASFADAGIAYSSIEHPAIHAMAGRLASSGATVHEIAVDHDGVIDLRELEKTLSSQRPGLVSVMAANNETGVIEPLEEISALCRENDALLHTDAAQIIGKAPFDVRKPHVDFATLASHKMGGPLGIGALYIHSGLELKRYFEGGSQETHRRPGTEPVPLIAGMGEAARILSEQGETEQAGMHALRDQMERDIHDGLPDVIVNGEGVERLCNTSSLTIPGVSAEMLVIRMDLEGFAISSGSACHSGRTEPSRILKAMGRSDDHAISSIRVSLGPDTTRRDIEQFVKTLIAVVNELTNSRLSQED